MCNFFSAIVLKNGEIVYDVDISSHEDLIEKAKLKDDTADSAKLMFARIEIVPKNGGIFTERKNWYLKIDQTIVPDWFSEEYEKKCMDLFFTEVYPCCVFIDKKYLVFRNRKNLFLKNSSVEVHGSSSADLYNSSTVIVHDSSFAFLHDSSSADFYNSSTAILYDSSSAELHDLSLARLYNSSSARLHDSSTARLYDSSLARLYDSSSADLSHSSSAVNFSKGTKFYTNDSSVVIDRTTEGIVVYSKENISLLKK